MMKTESWIMNHGVQTSALPWVSPVLDHELWKQDDITQNSPNPNITLLSAYKEKGWIMISSQTKVWQQQNNNNNNNNK